MFFVISYLLQICCILLYVNFVLGNQDWENTVILQVAQPSTLTFQGKTLVTADLL